jgi:hypothetical protein
VTSIAVSDAKPTKQGIRTFSVAKLFERTHSLARKCLRLLVSDPMARIALKLIEGGGPRRNPRILVSSFA